LICCAQTHLRAGEVSVELGVSERTVRRWITDGTLASVKIGGARLVARAELERRLGCSHTASEGEEGAVI